MNRTPLRIGLAVLVAVGLLGGVALVSADDGSADTDAIQWMHDRLSDHVHGDHHDHTDHHDGNHSHGAHHDGNHQLGEH
ncbi:hypothetical protein GS429_11540 [Natronorubrum sp. JWXQ-INN-674]|uniref:Uncharacterized protein n=1 Tax=Natronorubrum halalkaliphilum TaxID=2691917 RepID=A0A6B0VNJ5_9EURY|nr:hypothetical protein [Natronorubrum halalkaliphilum]MXV62687.1 hypothetical protein [Natronorubrum halalkaliphilum]